MAGGGAPTPAKGGKKSCDFVVNLVPMIDLLSVLISFLLITAVWTQLARINTDQAIAQQSNSPPPDQKETKINILVKAEGIDLNVTGEAIKRVEKTPDDKYLKDFRETLVEYSGRLGENPKVTLASEDKVHYKNVIQVMDICLDVGLTSITVGNTNAVKGELL